MCGFALSDHSQSSLTISAYEEYTLGLRFNLKGRLQCRYVVESPLRLRRGKRNQTRSKLLFDARAIHGRRKSVDVELNASK